MMKKKRLALNAICVLLLLCALQSDGQAPLPAADLGAVTTSAQKMFGAIDEIHTIGMTDDPGGRFDIIVIGSRPQNDGWRVVVFSVEHHRLSTKWDSAAMAGAPEFSSSGAKSVATNMRDYNYDIVIEGCAPHQCSDGVSGFLVFSGRAGETSKAKVTTRGLTNSEVGVPKYDVTFSARISSLAKEMLESAICNSQSISNKSGLPFGCEKR